MKQVKASIHRFGNSVAISFLGVDGETVYLDATQAEEFAKGVLECVNSVRSVKFSESTFGTKTYLPTNEDN